MTDIRPATVADLLDVDTVNRVEVAYQPGLNGGPGWLSTSVDLVRTYPDSVRWVRVEAVERHGSEVVVTVEGCRFAQCVSYPIVLRERAS